MARQAGDVALGYQNRGFEVETKSDASPVTAADRECEQLIAAFLSGAFPDDGLLGEEGAVKESRSGRRWIIDPIDGTRDFVRGLDTWGVLIALEDGGEIVAGFCNLPAQGELYFATRDGGAYRNNQRIRASAVSELSQAMVCVNGFDAIGELPSGPQILDWMSQFWAVRSMGGCQDAMLVASGRAEIWIEPGGKAWDFAPLKIIAEEAGARFFNFDGGRSIYGGNCVICVPALEGEAKRLLGLPIRRHC